MNLNLIQFDFSIIYINNNNNNIMLFIPILKMDCNFILNIFIIFYIKIHIDNVFFFYIFKF